MQNINKMLEMEDKQQYNQNITTITLKWYQNNTRKSTLILRAMFTFVFEGETSSRVGIYYNNIQDKISHTLDSYLF